MQINNIKILSILLLIIFIGIINYFFCSNKNKDLNNKQRVEIIEKRDEYSKTYKNSDGTYTLEAGVEPIHYFDKKAGLWQNLPSKNIQNILDNYFSKALANTNTYDDKYDGAGLIRCFSDYEKSFSELRKGECGFRFMIVGNTIPSSGIEKDWYANGYTTPPKINSGDFTDDGVLQRTFLPFNTSSLPDDAYINEAKLSLYVTFVRTWYRYGYYHIVKSTQKSTNNLISSDWSRVSISNGLQDSAGYFKPKINNDDNYGYLNKYLTAELSKTSWINTKGWTKLALIESDDLTNDKSKGFVEMLFGNGWHKYPPKLIITYNEFDPDADFDLYGNKISCNIDNNYQYNKLYWTLYPNADYYKIYRDGDYITSLNSSKCGTKYCEYKDKASNYDESHTYTIRAYAFEKYKSHSITIKSECVKLSINQNCDEPSNTLLWDVVNTSYTYDVVRKDGENGEKIIASNVKNGTYIDKDINKETEYTYKIIVRISKTDYFYTDAIKLNKCSNPPSPSKRDLSGIFMANEILDDAKSDTETIIITPDSHVINNPPPGFNDLLAPIWKEIVP